jgi:hypothetical protein
MPATKMKDIASIALDRPPAIMKAPNTIPTITTAPKYLFIKITPCVGDLDANTTIKNHQISEKITVWLDKS